MALKCGTMIKETLDANSEIISMNDDFLDFDNTAALFECMDVVPAVDTSLSHLSAALGRPTWILLSSNPGWRSIGERDDSPWYPSVKLDRQNSFGEWRDVFEQVAADLSRQFQII